MGEGFLEGRGDDECSSETTASKPTFCNATK